MFQVDWRRMRGGRELPGSEAIALSQTGGRDGVPTKG